ncbi:MAG TPA: hypothetical protein VK698_07355 [Kofleriaceae bacterium]|nr:hypothetical protein [Kofleriaceae bacterium]
MNRYCTFFGLVILLASGRVSAAPTLPRGWTRGTGTDPAVYAPTDREGVELRVHAPIPSQKTVGEWFAARRQTPPDGVAVSRYEDLPPVRGVFMAAATGAGGLTVLALGCRRASATMIYAELIAPDLETFRTYMQPAITLVLQTCFDRAITPAKEERAPAAPTAAKPDAFRYRAADGKGLRPAAIRAVVYSWSQSWSGVNLRMDESTYLLLANGKVRDGVPPVAPADFDAEAEMRAEPKKWGTWKKRGDEYQLAFAGQAPFEPPNTLERTPGRPGERLDGTYSKSSSYSVGSYGSWSSRSIAFGPDRRFSRSHEGGASIAGPAGSTPTSAGWDDSGSSVSTPTLGTRSRSGSTEADRQGTYHIDGYTLELRYDSGRVERHFFFTRDDRATVWFDGAELRDDSKIGAHRKQ